MGGGGASSTGSGFGRGCDKENGLEVERPAVLETVAPAEFLSLSS